MHVVVCALTSFKAGLRALIAAALLTVSAHAGPTPAFSQRIDDHTGCQVAIQAWNSSNVAVASAISEFIRNDFQIFDANHTNNGEPGILAGMTDRTMATMVAGVIGYCRLSPKATIYNESYQVYDGLRGIALQFGFAK